MVPRAFVEERIVCRQSTVCVITDCAPAHDGASDRLVLVMLHGTNRTGAGFLEDLAPYRAWADVLLPDLPGSGHSESLLEVGIGPMADEVVCLIRRRLPGRRLVLIGESTGALIGIACCDGRLPIAGLVMLDPPMSMTKQWVVHMNVLDRCRRDPDWYYRATAENVFGLDWQTGEVFERLYYAGLATLTAPLLIVRGDTPLFPVRPPLHAPNCFDDVDEMVVRMLLPGCVIERLSDCGHLVYIDGGVRCHDLVRAFVARIADA